VRTARIDAQLDGDFAGEDHARAVALIAEIGAELDMWKIVSQNDEVERAALTYANGDLERLERAVALALRDWRDLLVLVRGG
jgi:predicted AAA+ superfamily ATPase